MRLKCFHEPIDDADIVVFLGMLFVVGVCLLSVGFLIGMWWAS